MEWNEWMYIERELYTLLYNVRERTSAHARAHPKKWTKVLEKRFAFKWGTKIQVFPMVLHTNQHTHTNNHIYTKRERERENPEFYTTCAHSQFSGPKIIKFSLLKKFQLNKKKDEISRAGTKIQNEKVKAWRGIIAPLASLSWSGWQVRWRFVIEGNNELRIHNAICEMTNVTIQFHTRTHAQIFTMQLANLIKPTKYWQLSILLRIPSCRLTTSFLSLPLSLCSPCCSIYWGYKISEFHPQPLSTINFTSCEFCRSKE